MLSFNQLKTELLFTMAAMQVRETHTPAEVEIVNDVCKVLGVDSKLLKSQNRGATAVDARCIIYTLLRKNTNLSQKSIGQIFNRDHTTVGYSLKCFKNLQDSRNKEFMAKTTKVEAELPWLHF